MHIVILGSGIIGTTSAYYLAKQGHSVTVVDRQPAAAMETSFANAGQISPGYSAPWAAPGIPMKAVKWMMSKHSPLVVSPKPEWSKIKFTTRMLANCNASSYAINKGRMLRLAEYSRVSLQQLKQELNLNYDGESKGTLQVFRTEKQLKAAAKDIALLEEHGVPYELLDADGCVNVEPGLAAVKHKIVGGLRLVLDQTGDCFKLSTELVERCKEMGVEFKFDTQIKSLNMQQNEIVSVTTDAGELTADKYVMALGSYSTELLKQVGINSPVYPVKGYSITIPVTNEAAAPVSTIMDETYKVALTRLGDRIRVAGTAELNGYDLSLSEKRGDTIRHVVSDLFPEGTDLSEDNLWTGLRPMTPDGTPIIGATDVSNLFLNTGHGTLGWTMSFGSGRLLADIISGAQTDIECDDLSIKRYSNTFGSNRELEKALVTR
jgi:D-amino-acid dehydrogenase